MPRSTRLLVSKRCARIAVGLAFGVLFVAALRFRGGLYATGRAQTVDIVLVIVAAATAALVFVILRSPAQALAATVVLVGGACIAMVIASPFPG